MASTRLAEAVGYPGSSVAFAQLLSGMERDGLIRREVRGKRTYRITLAAAATARRQVQAPPAGLAEGGRVATTAAPAGGGAPPQMLFPSGIDYDELARRLLVQVIRRLNAAPAENDETLAVLLDENSRLREQVDRLRHALAESGEAAVTDELPA